MFDAEDHTFVVCAYGESPYLRVCVSSLVAQTTCTNILITTSTPNALIRVVANEFAVPLIINEGSPGIAHDWNCALNHAQTPLVTIAHQDDVYSCGFAENVLAYCNRAHNPLLCFTDYGEIRMSGGTESAREDELICDDSQMLRVKRRMLAPFKREKRWGCIWLRRRMMSLGSPICCPSVTYCLPNLPKPVFPDGMRGSLDWDAWERISKLNGEFVYVSKLLMRHRIHEGSETTALIRSKVRSAEDLEMFCRFWPRPVAHLLNILYRFCQKSNSLR